MTLCLTNSSAETGKGEQLHPSSFTNSCCGAATPAAGTPCMRKIPGKRLPRKPRTTARPRHTVRIMKWRAAKKQPPAVNSRLPATQVHSTTPSTLPGPSRGPLSYSRVPKKKHSAPRPAPSSTPAARGRGGEGVAESARSGRRAWSQTEACLISSGGAERASQLRRHDRPHASRHGSTVTAPSLEARCAPRAHLLWRRPCPPC